LRHTFEVALPESEEWPSEFATVASPPRQLHYVGDMSLLSRPCVAIVGSRHPSPYGERIARELSSALASAGACIVSGMAFGIDAAAHRAALDVGGSTAAVLGGGIDCVYPTAHRDLYDSIAQRGVLVSEFATGIAPFKGCFPRRNRIIAALCRLTIVVEASFKSGSLITAGHAADYGRNIAAVPGPIDSPQSMGSNQLLRDGAQVIASIDDALSLAALSARTATRPTLSLGGDEATVWDAVAQHAAATADEIITRTGWPASRCLAALTQLEIQGLLECSAAGLIERR
jgi:DNA processing protein